MSFKQGFKEAVLEAVNRDGLPEEVRKKGEPRILPLAPEHGPIAQAENEVVNLVRFFHEGRFIREDMWSRTNRNTRLSVRRLLWELYCNDPDGNYAPRPDRPFESFVERLTVPLAKFTVLVSVEGVKLAESPLDLEGCMFGTMEDLTTEADLQTIRKRGLETSGAWARVVVTAPSDKEAPQIAVERVSDAVDILTTLEFRVQESPGDAARIQIGEAAVVFDDREIKSTMYRAHGWVGRDFVIDRDLLDPRRRAHYSQTAFPWEQLPEGCEMRQVLHAAYRRLGRARRLTREMEAALPLAISALEVAVVSETRGTKYRTAARLILASIQANKPLIHPFNFVGHFDARNTLIHRHHEQEGWTWQPMRARDTFWGLYGALDLVSHVIVTHGVETRDALKALLHTRENVESAEGRIDLEIAELERLKDNARSKAFQDRIDIDIKHWQEICRMVRDK